MSGIRISKVKSEIALHENSFQSSAPDSEYVSLMKEDGSFENVAYKLIAMPTNDDPEPNMESTPPHDTYFVSISNPVEVYATTAPTVKKATKREVAAQQSRAVTAKKRDDKRRATHNEVERRRRDKINTWIMKLAALVPNSSTPDSASKGGILAKACDHITELNEKQKRLEKLEFENEKLVLEVFRLNQELTDLRKENTSVRNQLADNCIVFNQRKDQKS